MNQLQTFLGFVLCSALLWAGAAVANPVTTDNVTARIISEHRLLQAGQSFSVALQLDIRDGWHTYWRNPGDSGQATGIKWNLPEGVTASEIQWPYPERQYVGPVANYGYHGRAMHLIEMQLADDWPAGKPVVLTADANWLVCEEECIPEKAKLSVELASSEVAQIDSLQVGSFSEIRESLPKALPIKSGYQYAPDGRGIRFEFSPHAAITSAKKLAYFPHDWGVIQAPAEQQVIIDDAFVSISTNKGDMSFTKAIGGVLVVTSDRGKQLALTVESTLGTLSNGVLESDLPGVVGTQSRFEQEQSMSLIMALLFALVGGVILNLMPCVFPVLFMKALNLVSHSDQPPAITRRHGFAYTLGILMCFTLLGIVLVLVKAAGQQIGWGFQLQSPLFVSVVAMVLFILGLSLSGVVDIGTSFMGAGSKLANKSGYSGSFFTGVLAVVVATPCTAPFMGPALGFGLTQSTPVTLAVLLALGAGLALPYLVLTLVPGFTRYLPKPGAWMQRFAQLLAFPMYASAAWLVWVLGQQVGVNGVFSLLMLFILAAFAIWLWQATRDAGLTWRVIGKGACVAVIATILGVLSMQLSGTPSHLAGSSKPLVNGDALDRDYQVFAQTELTRLRASGEPVFVNMTAAWCITCLANEKVALSSLELSDYFSNNGITYMKGDWTNQNAEITAYLQSFSRASVPLYVYYPRGSGEPRVLPQILTVATVIDHIEIDASTATPSTVSKTNARGL